MMAILSQCLPLFGQRVETRQGNVYYINANRTVQISSGGMDSDPSLSFDGGSVIFVRRTLVPAGFEEPTEPNPVQTQIWTANIHGASEPKMVFAGPVKVGDSEYATFSEPKLAVDNRHAYFLIHYAVVEFGLIRVDLANGHAQLISGALQWDVIRQGRYAGDLVVQKRKPVGDGITDFFWLLTPEGKEIGFVGQSEEEAQEFLRSPSRALHKNPPVR